MRTDLPLRSWVAADCAAAPGANAAIPASAAPPSTSRRWGNSAMAVTPERLRPPASQNLLAAANVSGTWACLLRLTLSPQRKIAVRSVADRLLVGPRHHDGRRARLFAGDRPVARRVLDVDEEVGEAGRIGDARDLAAERTDQEPLGLLGALIDMEHRVMTERLVDGDAADARIAR